MFSEHAYICMSDIHTPGILRAKRAYANLAGQSQCARRTAERERGRESERAASVVSRPHGWLTSSPVPISLDLQCYYCCYPSPTPSLQEICQNPICIFLLSFPCSFFSLSLSLCRFRQLCLLAPAAVRLIEIEILSNTNLEQAFANSANSQLKQ